ncbi:MAG: fimbrillin family protein [Parabacteroides sp.]|nr:fimbrillin family protein [Parabacteroides sp.]
MKAQSSSLLFLLLILCECSSEIAEEADKILEKPVPILISSPRQIDIETKTVVNAFTTNDISNITIYGMNKTDGLYLEALSPVASNWNSLEFDTPITYPINGSDVTLYSFYPSTVQDRALSRGSMQIGVSISGDDDLMYTSVEAGNKRNPLPATLTFNHKLAQIKFKLKNLVTDSSETGPVTIIATGPSSAIMDLTDGSLNELSATKSFELPTNMTFDQLLADTETEIAGELLLFPQSEYSFSLKVGDKCYAITFDQQTTTSWQESSVYTLTISINSLNNPVTNPI